MCCRVDLEGVGLELGGRFARLLVICFDAASMLGDYPTDPGQVCGDCVTQRAKRASDRLACSRVPFLLSGDDLFQLPLALHQEEVGDLINGVIDVRPLILSISFSVPG